MPRRSPPPIWPASTRSSTSPLPKPPWKTSRAVLALGGRIVVGTTGWYAHLERDEVAWRKSGGALLYGTNFSIGVQKLFRLTAALAQLDGYKFSIDETHHITKLDAPSGTAITLREIIQARSRGAQPRSRSPRTASATPWASTLSRLSAMWTRWNSAMKFTSRRCLAEGAVRGAEWLAGKPGAWEFREIFDQL